MRRFKLKKYAGGRAVKEVLGSIFDDASGSSTLGEPGIFVAGWNGTIAPSAIIYTDGWLYSDALFEREYSIENPDIDPDGVGLDVNPTQSSINDMTQFGDYVFNLTNETMFGTTYATTTTPSSDVEDYYWDKHQLVSYEPGLENFGIIDKIFKTLSFEFETDSVVFGTVSAGRILVYIDSNDFVYALDSKTSESLPFAYLLEQPLNTPVKITSPVEVFGNTADAPSGTAFLYSPNPSSGLFDFFNNTVYTTEEIPDDNQDKMYFNPFKLKNMYNYNWNMEYNGLSLEVTGIRDYQHIGKAQGSIWLTYKYLRENPTVVSNYEFAERIRGLFKYRPTANHKSNIYSIKIYNSGLNEAMPNGALKDSLRELVKNSIHTAVKKIAPASTQLWKIEWIGD